MPTCKHTPWPVVVSLEHVLVTTKHGTYPVHRHWFDSTDVCERRAERERLRQIYLFTTSRIRRTHEAVA